MSIDRGMVDYVARLARLVLTDDERDRFAGQLNSILEYCAKLNELATDGVEPTSTVVETINVARDDAVRPSLQRDEILAAAPEHEAGFFKVPPILESEPRP